MLLNYIPMHCQLFPTIPELLQFLNLLLTLGNDKVLYRNGPEIAVHLVWTGIGVAEVPRFHDHVQRHNLSCS